MNRALMSPDSAITYGRCVSGLPLHRTHLMPCLTRRRHKRADGEVQNFIHLFLGHPFRDVSGDPDARLEDGNNRPTSGIHTAQALLELEDRALHSLLLAFRVMPDRQGSRILQALARVYTSGHRGVRRLRASELTRGAELRIADLRGQDWLDIQCIVHDRILPGTSGDASLSLPVREETECY